jgi:hypothetical protein
LRQFLLDDRAEILADIQAYLQNNLGVSYTIGGISDLCKRLKIKLKTGRPVNVRQQPRAVESFKKKFKELRSDYADSAIFFHDELRAGTRSELSQKWTPIEHRLIALVKIGYENTYLYLTLCPFTGKGFGAFLPKLNSECFSWFISKIQECIDQTEMPEKALFITDGATAHKVELFDKAKLVFERLPAACHELNPVERFLRNRAALAVRKKLKNKIFDTLEIAQEGIQMIVENFFEEEGKVSSLTCFPYLKNTT